MTRLHLVVSGLVQGVGFRWYARERARGLGLAGWIRNREDGTVEAEAEGPQEALRSFVESLKAYPVAHVEDVEERWISPKGERGFLIR